jgi:hypothetical protein
MRKRAPTEGKQRQRWLGWPAGVLLFVVSLLIRLLFATATADKDWPYSVAFKGDAPLWLDYATALDRGEPFELGLPLHPPGTAYLLAALLRAHASIPSLRFVWCLAGALTVVCVWAAVARSFGSKPALVAGALAAGSTGLIVLSSSLNSETPYLLLVAASFVFLEDLRRGARLPAVAAFAALNALACLFRVEHVLAFALISIWFAWQQQADKRLSWLGVLAVAFALPLVPWHVHAWRALSRFNSEPPQRSAAEAAAVSAVEDRTRAMVWDEGARRERDRLPAFARSTAGDFVAATVLHNGGARVSSEDFRILSDAFGYVPAPLACCPFVSTYGPLNFALANHPAAGGGFSRAALEESPPLVFAPTRYPRDLVFGLPPPDLSLVYPPHVRLVNEGYRIGWGWIAERPGRFLRLVWRKLTFFWSGASLGFGGYDLPLGMSGVRRAVDMVTPEDGALVTAWQLGALAVTILGIILAWRHESFAPWLLFLASKVLVTVLFFGYARHGACVIPVVALCAALAMDRLARAWPFLVFGLLGLLAVAETVRWVKPPAPTVDGHKMETVDPFRDLHRDQRIRFD